MADFNPEITPISGGGEPAELPQTEQPEISSGSDMIRSYTPAAEGEHQLPASVTGQFSQMKPTPEEKQDELQQKLQEKVASRAERQAEGREAAQRSAGHEDIIPLFMQIVQGKKLDETEETAEIEEDEEDEEEDEDEGDAQE